MKKEELTKVFALAKGLWSSFNLPNNELDVSITASLWLELLKPYELEIIKLAMIEHAKRSDFLNMAKVSEICFEIMARDNPELDEEQIFMEIKKAITYYECKANFEKLSPVAKIVVGDPSQLATWSLIPQSEVLVLESNLHKRINARLQDYKRQLSIENTLPQITSSEQKQIEHTEEDI